MEASIMVDTEGNSGTVGDDEESVESRDGWLDEPEEAEGTQEEGVTEVKGPHGLELWQFPISPGRQCEQEEPLLTHKHLRHFADPLHRQHHRGRGRGRDEVEDMDF